MKNLKLFLVGATLLLANGCAMVSVVSVQPKAKSEQPGNHLSGAWRVGGADVRLFDPRDPSRPAWYPENFFCQSPWPVGLKVEGIELIQENQKACRYEFDEAGRLTWAGNDDHQARLEYGGAAATPDKVTINGQRVTLNFEPDENQIEEKI